LNPPVRADSTIRVTASGAVSVARVTQSARTSSVAAAGGVKAWGTATRRARTAATAPAKRGQRDTAMRECTDNTAL